MKTKYFIPVFIAVIVLATASCCGGGTAEAPEYQSVTIAELIGNASAYHNDEVMVSGRYVDFTGRPEPECEPYYGCGVPTQSEAYTTYPTTWGIAGDDGEIGVVVVYDAGTLVHILPNYEDGQTIKLKGTAIATTTTDPCYSFISRRSLYIAVDADDIDITIEE